MRGPVGHMASATVGRSLEGGRTLPHRIGGRGTFVLDRVFKGVGRVRRASGTLNRRMLQALDGMLSELYQRGRLDILKAIADGRLTPMEVWGLRQEYGLDQVPREAVTQSAVGVTQLSGDAPLRDDVRNRWHHLHNQVRQVVDETIRLDKLPPAQREALWRTFVVPMIASLSTLKQGD